MSSAGSDTLSESGSSGETIDDEYDDGQACESCHCGLLGTAAWFSFWVMQLIAGIIAFAYWQDELRSWRHAAFIWELILLSPLLYWVCNLCAGWMVRNALIASAQRRLGIKVEIDTLRPNVCQGIVNINRLLLHNPPGYEASHLLKVRRVTVDFEARSVIRSCGRRCVITELHFRDVDVIVEKSPSTSNVQDLLRNLKKGLQQRGITTEAEIQEARLEREYIIHTAHFHNVEARVQIYGAYGLGTRFSLPDRYYADFSAEHDVTRAKDIATAMLTEMLTSVLFGCFGWSSPEAPKRKSLLPDRILGMFRGK